MFPHPWIYFLHNAQYMGSSRASRQGKENTRPIWSAELWLPFVAIALRTCIQPTQQMFIQHLPYARDFSTYYRRHYPTLEIRKPRLRKVKKTAQGHEAGQISNPSLLTSGPELPPLNPAGRLSDTGMNIIANACIATLFQVPYAYELI